MLMLSVHVVEYNETFFFAFAILWQVYRDTNKPYEMIGHLRGVSFDE